MRSNGGLVHVSDRSSSPVLKGELGRENNRESLPIKIAERSPFVLK